MPPGGAGSAASAATSGWCPAAWRPARSGRSPSSATPEPGSALTPILWLRLEGAAALSLSAYLYARTGQGWLLFALLLLAPDLSMLGYLAGSRAGAAAYNLFHSYALPLALGAYAVALESPPALALALIWTAHIGMDRMLGYGLKLPTGFRHTHLGEL